MKKAEPEAAGSRQRYAIATTERLNEATTDQLRMAASYVQPG
jgi:hypothetical protein